MQQQQEGHERLIDAKECNATCEKSNIIDNICRINGNNKNGPPEKVKPLSEAAGEFSPSAKVPFNPSPSRPTAAYSSSKKQDVSSADLAARAKYQSIMLSEEPPATSTTKPVEENGSKTESVNYGYHPIIDFFR